jgi:hypothetical protein
MYVEVEGLLRHIVLTHELEAALSVCNAENEDAVVLGKTADNQQWLAHVVLL